jgi:hypothetical protein
MQASVSLDAILRRVIRRGFPELARKRIVMTLGEYDDWMFYEPAGQGRGSFVIGVDTSLLGAPRRAIAGAFAHELAHILRDSRIGRWQLDRAWSLYHGSRAFRIRDERETDGEAIARGYGRELLELMLFARARGYRWDREDGLTLPEVHKRCGAAMRAAAGS